MKKTKSKNYNNRRLDEKNIKLTLLQLGRFANLLFIIGCLLNFIEFDYSESALLGTNESTVFDNELRAAEIATYVSIIFLIAIIIFTGNALTTLKLDLNNLNLNGNSNAPNNSSIQGPKIIAFSDLIKVVGYFGAAIGTIIVLDTLENI